tara:strand:- start:5158 stop:6357 length:1200 start_codon:yes stop_codon:yes gene_type:complete
MKFGGTSVGNIDRIKNVAKIVKKSVDHGNSVVVAVSAMAGVTNELQNKAENISKNFNPEDRDLLLSSGEQVSTALLSGALNEIKIKAKTLMSWQIPIVTEGKHSNSRIISVNTDIIKKLLNQNFVVVIPGFQGINEQIRINTLGRGGSDASAVALAKCLNAVRCEIFTDVDGVFTTDPDVNSEAKKIDKISYDEMLEMSSLGAKVMQSSSVQSAMLNNIEVYVKSSFKDTDGTAIINQNKISYDKVITGVAFTKDDAKITLQGVKDKPGVASSIFKPLYENNIVVDMIVQNISADKLKTDITFTVKRSDFERTNSIMKSLIKNLDYEKIISNDKVSKVSVIGAGMITYPGVAYKMFDSLYKENINILAITTSEIKISVLIDEINVENAIKKLHSVFDLD